MRPKILYISQQWPAEAGYGAQQRALNIGRLLKRFGDVSFVIASPNPENQQTIRDVMAEFEICRVIRPLAVARKNPFDRFRRRLRHEFDSSYMATEPWTLTEEDRGALLQLMEQYDVVWVHNVRTANLVQIDRWPHSVLDVDDIPSCYFSTLAQSRDNPVRRLLDLRMSWIWKRRERHLAERFDVFAVCSEQDRRYLSGLAQAHVIPNGFNAIATRPQVRSECPRIGFIGTFAYGPNQEGVRWFIRNVWPLIRREVRDAQLRLVGRGSDSLLQESGPGIAKLDWLDDPGDEIATWSAMVVPIQFGGGTRIKIAEGFARKCPVVSTTIGAFGYDVRHGEEILLADTPEDFASACVDLCRHHEFGRVLSERAYERFLGRWTWDSMEGAVGAAVEECVAGRSSSLAPMRGGLGSRDAARHVAPVE